MQGLEEPPREFVVALEALVMAMFSRAVAQAARLGIAAHIDRGQDSIGRPRVCLCLGPTDSPPLSRYCITIDVSRRRVIHQQHVPGASPRDSQLETQLAGLNETVLNTELSLFFRRATQLSLDLLAGHKVGF